MFGVVTATSATPFELLIDHSTDPGTTLIFNSDPAITVWVTSKQTGNPPLVPASPIPPNGNLIVDGTEDIYCFTMGGRAVLYLYPSSVGFFRGLTQGLGNLAIPSLRSPNYVPSFPGPGIGWAIFQDGSADFNNLTIRGTFTGNNFVINNSGEFFYSGTPAAGNLIASIATAAGTDVSGNAYLAGITSYRNVGGTFIAANQNPTTGGAVTIYSAASEAGPWTIQGNLNGNNAGQIWLASQDGGVLQLSNSGAALLSAFIGQSTFTIQNDTAFMTLQCTNLGIPEVINGNDSRTYALGQSLGIVGGATLINSTTPIPLVTFANVAAGTYHVKGRVRFTSATGTTQPMSIRIGGTATASAVEVSTMEMQEIPGAAVQPGAITALNADPSVSPTLPNSLNWRWDFDGIVRVSAAGSLILTGRQGTSAADETFTVTANSWMELEPTI